jgi:hypothetical protein
LEKSILTVEITRAIRESESCPLCYLWMEEESRVTEDMLSNEVCMDPTIRKQVTRARGFCNAHSYLLFELSTEPSSLDGSALALYLESVFEDILRELERHRHQATEKKGRGGKMSALGRRLSSKSSAALAKGVAESIRSKGTCYICDSLENADLIHVSTLVRMLRDGDFREEFRGSHGLCLPHLISALLVVSEQGPKDAEEIVSALVSSEVALFRRLHRLLSERLRKMSWDARNEPIGEERDANRLALRTIAGAQGLYGSRNRTTSRGVAER